MADKIEMSPTRIGQNVRFKQKHNKHKKEEDLQHELVMERWTAGRFYLSGFGFNWFLMWDDIDPYLFAGPVHEIVPYNKGALCWDWEIGSWEYYEPWFESWSDVYGGLWKGLKILWNAPNILLMQGWLHITQAEYLGSLEGKDAYYLPPSNWFNNWLRKKYFGFGLGNAILLTIPKSGVYAYHELRHTQQSQLFGWSFIPLYLLGCLFNPNPFEWDATRYGFMRAEENPILTW